MSTLINSCSEFICSYWGADHCDPNSWSYQPSTYGVEGVGIVAGPHMNERKCHNDFQNIKKKKNKKYFKKT